MRQLYDAYAPSLFGNIRRYVPEKTDAEDILQDSLIKIFSSMDSFTPKREGSLGAWMRKICVNEALMFLRKRKRLSTMELLPQLPDDIPQEDDPPPLDGIPPAALQEMIQSLPDGYRTVLNLYVFEKLSHKEISARLGISVGTSASQYSRAKALLAKKIRSYTSQKEEK